MFTVAFLAAAGCDVVTTEYDTLAEARADRLFERGWLPDILPPSSYDIRVSNDLDVDTSQGHFSFSPQEFDVFAENLMESAAIDLTLSRSAQSTLERLRSERYPLWRYSASGATWIFSCPPSQGKCEYVMGLSQ
jgi:hypothetical protein